MQPHELILLLNNKGSLPEWKAVISEGDKEFVVGTWYNMALVLAEGIEHQMDVITKSMWELGLQAFDWDAMYDLLEEVK